MTHRIGIAISVYNKGAFVATNLNVFKHLWKKTKPYVAVSCNDPATFEKLSKLSIDNLIAGWDIPVTGKPTLRLRQYDTIKKSVTAAAEKSDYVIHWHGDAFALDPASILEIVDHMDQNNYLFAARGFWKDYCGPKIPDGDIDDHFFVINSQHVRDTQMYSDDDEQLKYVQGLVARGLCSEGILSNLVQKVTPEDKVYIYSDMKECEVLPTDREDDRYEDKIPHRTLPSVNFDPGRKFLHCDDMLHLERIFVEQGIDTNLIVKEL